MPGPQKQFDRATGEGYEVPSVASEQRVNQILTMPVPPGSTRRRDELIRHFSSLSTTEAARLHSKLSNPKDKQHLLMRRRLSQSTVPKVLDVLQAQSGRQTAKPVPDRMTDEALKEEFLSIVERPHPPAKNTTSFEETYAEDRSAELFGELSNRGQAFTVPDPARQHAEAAKTAKALGLTIPPSVLARADQIIE